MWKFLLICAFAVCAQAICDHTGQEISSVERKKFIKNLRDLLAGDSSDSSSEESMNAVDHGGMVVDILKAKYEELFTTMASDIQDGLQVAEPIAYVIDRINSHRPSITPCMDLAQLAGAVRFWIVSDLQPGMYYTLHEALQQAMRETGHTYDLDRDHIRYIGHAILQPVFDALEEIECDIGIGSNCPHKDSAMYPRPTPMEQLFWDTKAYMDKVDFKKTDVGTVIAGFLERVWMKVFDEKFPSTYTCKTGINQTALVKLGEAIESLKMSTSYEELQSRLGSVINDHELVNRLADILIQNHFATKFEAMQGVKQFIGEWKTKGLDVATSRLNGYVLSMIYESTRDEELYDLVLKDALSIIEAGSMNRPLRDTSVEDLVKMSSVVLQSIPRYWKTPCLNARLIGMLAGFVQVQQIGAIENERVADLYISLVKELGLSTIDTSAEKAFHKILDVTIREPMKPFVENVLKIAGPQATELTLFELQQTLSRHRYLTIKEGVHTLLATIVPLLKHNEGQDSVYTCRVSNEDLSSVVQQAYGIVDRLGRDSFLEDVKRILTGLSSSSPHPISQEWMNDYATNLMKTLKHEMWNMTRGLQTLEGVTAHDAVNKLTTYLATTLGYSVKYIVEEKWHANEPVHGPGDTPINPTDFVAWQQRWYQNL